MAKYTYTAISAKNPSQIIEGEMEASSRDDVIASLGRQRLSPLSIKQGSSESDFLERFFSKKSVKADEIVIFTRQLSAMIGAGVSLTRSLSSLADQAENPVFKKVLSACVEDIQAGSGFGDTLAHHPSVFSDVYVNMVRAGETAGILDDILKRLAMQQEKSSSIRKKIKSAMSYPMVLLFITIIAFFGLMLFVIPQIGKIILDLGGPDAKLPMLTQVMLGISGFMVNFWYIVLPAFGGGVMALLRYIKTPQGKIVFHKVVLKVPAVGGIIKKVAVARMARTYSSLIGAGVPVVEALSVTSRAIGNTVYETHLTEAIERVKNGEQLSTVVAENKVLYPSILAQMLAVGEETGQTDTVLIKVADFYEEEVDVAIDGISSIIEPVMIVLMGSMVGLIAASVMGPIASISQNIK